MLAPAVPLGLSPSNAPSEFLGDDCFKFFNPVSTDSLNQYTAEWKLALMRASKYLADEHIAAAAAAAGAAA